MRNRLLRLPPMECGLVGLPGSGKSTLFHALTGAAPPAAAAMKPTVGMAQIPDPRLRVIASYITTRKIIPATIQFVDIPGVAPGSEPAKLNAFLSHVRTVDAVCHVVRCFDDGTGVIDAPGDIDRMDTELALADLVVAESALDRATRAARAGDAETKARAAVLERVNAVLNDGRPIRHEPWTDTERAILKSYGMITSKPVLYIANIAEDDLADESEPAGHVRAHAASTGSESVALCARLEAELAEIDESDREEMLRSMGLAERAIGPMARAVYALLGLASFYTAGDKEVRAWTIRKGATAPEAAGAIHGDLQRGFIRAECYHVDDLVKHKTEKAIREAGRMRSEGKGYQMQDGDVAHILFNV
jgi:ribosome-binding ATPase